MSQQVLCIGMPRHFIGTISDPTFFPALGLIMISFEIPRINYATKSQQLNDKDHDVISFVWPCEKGNRKVKNINKKEVNIKLET